MSKQAIEKELKNIQFLIQRAENMCLASDGPVGKTISEMSDGDIKKIWQSTKKALKLLRAEETNSPEEAIDKLFPLAKEPCGTCGGSGKRFLCQANDGAHYDDCPACKPTELAAYLRKIVSYRDGSAEPLAAESWDTTRLLKYAAERIDRLTAELKEKDAQLNAYESRPASVECPKCKTRIKTV